MMHAVAGNPDNAWAFALAGAYRVATRCTLDGEGSRTILAQWLDRHADQLGDPSGPVVPHADKFAAFQRPVRELVAGRQFKTD